MQSGIIVYLTTILHGIYRFYIKVTIENINDFAQFEYSFHMEIIGFYLQDLRFAVGYERFSVVELQVVNYVTVSFNHLPIAPCYVA